MELEQYKSLREKDDYFQTGSFVISRTVDFDSALPMLLAAMKDEFVFRGINEAKYKLYNSGQRKFIQNGLYTHAKSYQEFILDETDKFKIENKSNFWEYLKEQNISGENYLAILSMMQHCGRPTPCIDFTNNLLIALYFAFSEYSNFIESEIDEYVSIYFLSRKFSHVHFIDFSLPIVKGLALRNVFKGENHSFDLNNDIPFSRLSFRRRRNLLK